MPAPSIFNEGNFGRGAGRGCGGGMGRRVAQGQGLGQGPSGPNYGQGRCRGLGRFDAGGVNDRAGLARSGIDRVQAQIDALQDRLALLRDAAKRDVDA